MVLDNVNVLWVLLTYLVEYLAGYRINLKNIFDQHVSTAIIGHIDTRGYFYIREMGDKASRKKFKIQVHICNLQFSDAITYIEYTVVGCTLNILVRW